MNKLGCAALARASWTSCGNDQQLTRFIECDYIVTTIMKTRLVRIGNSRGIRLPKLVIEEAGLSDEVELRVRPGAIVIAPATGPRAEWAKAARRLRERGGDGLLESVTPTWFDEHAWTW